MRVLFSTLVSYSVFHSQVPLAFALRDAGHDVAFATGPGFGSWVRRVGFPAFPAGIDGPAYVEELGKRFPEWPAGVRREDGLRFWLTNEDARFAAPWALPDLLAIVRQWKPDLLVHDTSEFAGPIAATVAGIPYANHSWGLLPPLDIMRAAGEAVAPLWERHGLDPDAMGGMFTHLYLDIAPPAIQVPEINELGVSRTLRPVLLHFRLDTDDDSGDSPATSDEQLPGWFGELPEQPTVYVALGTIFNDTSVFATILDGLRDEKVNVLVNLGQQNDPSTLGPQPPNVRVERYLPQSQLLPRCHVVVSHGGPATMLAALSCGLPMLMLPRGSDQFRNAQQCVNAGVARQLLDGELTPDRVRDEVRGLLGDGGWGDRAGAVRGQIEQMPSPAGRVALLEALAADGALA